MTYYMTAPVRTRWVVRNEAQAHSLAVNVREEDNTYTLTALVPGLRAEDLTIQVIEDVVSIEGSLPTDENSYLLRELPQGEFRRALRLPVLLDAEKAEASVENGLLTLRVPKAQSALPKTIKVVSK